jgi:drug/metabolite transporter (DMT)-like permease
MSTTASQKSSLTRGYTIAVASAAVLSFTAIFIRHLTETYHIPALVLAFWREVFVVLTLLAALRLLRRSLLRVERRHLRYLFAYGLLLAAFNAIWTLSVSLNGAAISTVLVFCSAGFTALLGRWLLKERLDWVKIVAVVLSLSGCVLVSGALDAATWSANVMGISTGIISGLGYAGYSLMGRSASQRGLNPWTTVLYTFGFATIFLLCFNLLPGGPLPGSAVRPADLFWLGKSVAGWAFLYVLAAGPTLGGYGLYTVSLSHLPSSVANLIVTLEPVVTSATAYVFLHERLNGIQVVGSLMILAGVAFLRIYEGWMERQVKTLGLRKAGTS